MNKRARNRLIGVTVIVLAIIAALFAASSATGGSPAYYKTVSEVVKAQDKYVGTNLQIGGPVVQGSWNKKSRPMKFKISDDKNKSATLDVVYNGSMPNTFGDGVVAIVTGTLEKGGTVQATALETKCPEKEASRTAAYPVDKVVAGGSSLVGAPLQTVGTIAAGSMKPAGSDYRFILTDKTGKTLLKVRFDGGLPGSVKEGVDVVVGGSMSADGTFNGTSVAIAK